jgi:hypothetical protein
LEPQTIIQVLTRLLAVQVGQVLLVASKEQVVGLVVVQVELTMAALA